MRQEEALRHLREMIWALQRYRSVAMETLGRETGELHLSEKMAAEVWPWVFGEKCPLPILVKMVDNAETSGTLAPMDYYNMMTILDRFMPEIKVATVGWRGTYTLPEGPPSLEILRGWDND